MPAPKWKPFSTSYPDESTDPFFSCQIETYVALRPYEVFLDIRYLPGTMELRENSIGKAGAWLPLFIFRSPPTVIGHLDQPKTCPLESMIYEMQIS
jgi:hypothetical protein